MLETTTNISNRRLDLPSFGDETDDHDHDLTITQHSYGHNTECRREQTTPRLSFKPFPATITSHTRLAVVAVILIVLARAEVSSALSCFKCLPRKINNWCSEGFGPEEQCWAQDSSCLKVDFLTQAGGIKRRIVLRQCISDTYLAELDTVFVNMKHANDCILHRDDAIAILLHGNRRSAQLYDTQERSELANVVRFGSELLRAMDQGFLHSKICRCNTPMCNAAVSGRISHPTMAKFLVFIFLLLSPTLLQMYSTT